MSDTSAKQTAARKAIFAEMDRNRQPPEPAKVQNTYLAAAWHAKTTLSFQGPDLHVTGRVLRWDRWTIVVETATDASLNTPPREMLIFKHAITYIEAVPDGD